MTTTELLKRLFYSVSNQNMEEFYKVAEEFINLEKRKNHNTVAKELKDALYEKNTSNKNVGGKKFISNMPIPRDSEKGFPLFEIKEYEFDWQELIINEETLNILKQIVTEYNDIEVLASYNLKPKNKVLFCGKPGTGKTFSAKIISSVLRVPLIYIRFDAIISSYLGETAANLKKVFDYINNGMWVVLFDEFDIIGKNRDDQYEHGEIKRVVNNFLQMLDNFEGESLLIAATNHQHMLDSAIWRRFDEVIYFDLPEAEERYKLLKYFLKSIKRETIDLKKIVEPLNGFSPSDLKLISIEAMKHSIIAEHKELNESDLNYAINRFIDRNNIKTGKGGVNYGI